MVKGKADSYNYGAFSISPYEKWYRDFLRRLPVGSMAPNFKARDTEGNWAVLSQFRNKASVVLEFGCMTCAPAVTQTATYRRSLSSIMPHFSKRGVRFLMVYTRETHPGEYIPKHTSFDQKLTHAKRFKEEDRVKIRVIVDSLDGEIHRKYGWLPNMVYIIDKLGRIAYKASWTDVNEVESVLENLLLWESKGFTPLDSVAVVEKYHFIYDRNVEEHARVYRRSGPRAVRDLRREVKLPI